MGYIVGNSEHLGHALTWQSLFSDTNRLVMRSLVRPFDPNHTNLRADLLGGAISLEITMPSSQMFSTQPGLMNRMIQLIIFLLLMSSILLDALELMISLVLIRVISLIK
jgi:hypothetical protein